MKWIIRVLFAVGFASGVSAQGIQQTLPIPLPATLGGTGLSALGTGVSTALGINVGSAGSPVTNGGALGTPSSGTGTNITGVNAATLGGATFAAPGPIGSGTPSTGAHTTLTASGTTTIGTGGAATSALFYLNGGSDSGKGAVFTGQRAGVDKFYIGTESQIATNTSDTLALSSVGAGIKFFGGAGGTTLLGTVTTAGAVSFPLLAASSQTSAACYNSGTGALTYNSGVTTCLASTARVKDLDRRLTPNEGLQMVLAAQPWIYTNKDDADLAPGQQIGFVAEAETNDPRLVARDMNGTPNGFRYEQFTAGLAAAIQAQQIEINSLKARRWCFWGYCL